VLEKFAFHKLQALMLAFSHIGVCYGFFRSSKLFQTCLLPETVPNLAKRCCHRYSLLSSLLTSVIVKTLEYIHFKRSSYSATKINHQNTKNRVTSFFTNTQIKWDFLSLVEFIYMWSISFGTVDLSASHIFSSLLFICQRHWFQRSKNWNKIHFPYCPAIEVSSQHDKWNPVVWKQNLLFVSLSVLLELLTKAWNKTDNCYRRLET
jgi:hypothetical protein